MRGLLLDTRSADQASFRTAEGGKPVILCPIVSTLVKAMLSRALSYGAGGMRATRRQRRLAWQSRVVINQRKRCDPELRRVLADHQSLRDLADYRPALI
jgi:hypothetical protein